VLYEIIKIDEQEHTVSDFCCRSVGLVSPY
jgi:hypothetical protein